MRLKPWVKVLYIVLFLITIILFCTTDTEQDRRERAEAECGGPVITHYDNAGVSWYTCK